MTGVGGSSLSVCWSGHGWWRRPRTCTAWRR